MLLAIGVLGGLVLYLVYLSKDCFFRVMEGEVAVVSRLGGALRQAGGPLRRFGPGLHAKWPFDRAHVVSLKEQVVPLSTEKGHEPLMLNDGTVVRLDAVVRYRVSEEGLERFVFGMHHPQQHLSGLYSCLLRNEVANAKAEVPGPPEVDPGGAFALIRRQRRLVNQRISDFIAGALGARYGVDFRAVDIVDINPPDELADALNSVMSARAAADELRFRVASENAQKVMAAEKGVEIARLQAEAVEEEMSALAEELGRLERQGTLADYVARRKAEVLSDVKTVYLRDGEPA